MFPVVDKVRTGKRIQFWMGVCKLKPKDIQKYLSLSCVQTVYRWLDGTNIPSVDNLYAMTRLFGVKMSAIIVGNELEICEASPLLMRTHPYWILYEAKKFR